MSKFRLAAKIRYVSEAAAPEGGECGPRRNLACYRGIRFTTEEKKPVRVVEVCQLVTIQLCRNGHSLTGSLDKSVDTGLRRDPW